MQLEWRILICRDGSCSSQLLAEVYSEIQNAIISCHFNAIKAEKGETWQWKYLRSRAEGREASALGRCRLVLKNEWRRRKKCSEKDTPPMQFGWRILICRDGSCSSQLLADIYSEIQNAIISCHFNAVKGEKGDRKAVEAHASCWGYLYLWLRLKTVCIAEAKDDWKMVPCHLREGTTVPPSRGDHWLENVYTVHVNAIDLWNMKVPWD